MRKLLLLGALVACAGSPATAAPHGGAYMGPGPTTPGPAGPLTPSGPDGPTTTDSGAAGDPTRWEHWWQFNQAPYLELRKRIRQGEVLSAPGADVGEGASGAAGFSAALAQGVVIPRLLEALRTEKSDDIQSACMVALGKIGDPEGPPEGSARAREVWREIQKRLVSPSQELAETAALALGIAGHRANIPLLAALLANDREKLRELGIPELGEVNVRTRAFAAYGLGLIGHGAGEYDRLVINATLRSLLDGEARGMAQRDVPVACIVALGLTPLPVDRREGETVDAKAERGAGAMTSRQDQLRFLLAYFADDSVNVLTRAQAPTALARLLCAADVPDGWAPRSAIAQALMRCLAADSKADNSMQQSCILALGMLGDCDEDPLDVSIRAALMGVEKTIADQQSQRFALMALARSAGRPGRGKGDPLDGVDTRVHGANARSYLLGELLREKGPARPWAAIALAVLERSLDDAGKGSSHEVKQALRAMLLSARSPEQSGASAIACGIAREEEAKTLLFRNLTEMRDPWTRGTAAIALGMLDEQTAIAPIAEIARQSKNQAGLLRCAAIALGLLGDNRLVPDLIEMLSSAGSLSSQAAISMALGMVGDSRSVPALVVLLQDRRATELARAFGAVALGIVADKEDLPWNAKISVDGNYRANTATLTDGKSGIIDIL